MATQVRGDGRPYVLAADDVESILLFIEAFLGHHAHVVKATTDQQAVQLARAQRYAVILLDVHMGGMTGMQIANEIRMGINQNTPIVFLTGASPTPAQLQTVLGPPCGVLLKPFNASALLQKVMPWLAPTAAPGS